MKFWLKLAVALVIGLEGLVTLIWIRRVTDWWWGLRMRTRVIVALAHVAVIVGVGIVHQLG